jgi:hypothetical protein
VAADECDIFRQSLGLEPLVCRSVSVIGVYLIELCVLWSDDAAEKTNGMAKLTIGGILGC